VSDAALNVSVLPAEPDIDREFDSFFGDCPASFAQQTRH
jgi:hypothetical protein